MSQRKENIEKGEVRINIKSSCLILIYLVKNNIIQSKICYCEAWGKECKACIWWIKFPNQICL